MTKKTKRHTSTNSKNALLEAGKKLFARKGFDGVSVKDLASEAGVNISLVSYHFGGKDGLYKACLEQFGKQKHELLQRLLQSPKTLDEAQVRIRMLFEEMIRSYLEEPDLCKMVHRDIELGNAVSEDIFKKRFLSIFEILLDFVRDGQKNKIFREDLEVITVAGTVFGIIMHLTRIDPVATKYYNRSLADPEHVKLILDSIIKMIFSGITKQHGTDRHGGRK